MEKHVTSRPRTVFLSSGGLLGGVVLQRLIDSRRFDVVGIVRSRRMMHRDSGFVHGTTDFFRRCGLFYSLYIWLITPFAEFLGSWTGRGSITKLAKRHGIPVLHTRDVNNPQGLDFIDSCRADLLVTAHFNQKLHPPLCDQPDLAAINIHPSLLPADRGLDPVFHTMRRGGDEFGVTVHRMVPELDQGAVLASRRHVPARPGSVFKVTYDLMSIGAELLVQSADVAVRAGEGTEQSGDGNYNTWPGRRDVRLLHRARRRIILLQDFKLFGK